MPFLLHLLQNANAVPSITATASGRLMSDPDFSRAFNELGGRPVVTGSAEGTVCTIRCSNTVVRISLNTIPLNEASCPISQTAEAMAELFTQVGMQAPRFPYAIDFQRKFFIPAGAIECVLEDGTEIVCEGMFDATDNTIRIDAVDQQKYAWFYATARLRVV